MLYERDAQGSVDDVCARLAQAAADHHFGVLAVHDLKQKMTDKGVAFGPQCRVLEVCNPHQAKAVLDADPSISTALPCRIAVYEHGDRIVVSTLKPTGLLETFGHPELRPVAHDVEAALIRIIDTACGA